eukprot:11302502-Alexandrium_andersonii.AAC.1
MALQPGGGGTVGRHATPASAGTAEFSSDRGVSLLTLPSPLAPPGLEVGHERALPVQQQPGAQRRSVALRRNVGLEVGEASS